MNRAGLLLLSLATAVLLGCSHAGTTEGKAKELPAETPVYFRVDPATAGVIKGRVQYTGAKVKPRVIDMDQDPECARLHKSGRAVDESLVLNARGMVANTFVYIREGLDGKEFEPPSTPVTIDQNGCWFRPRVLGIQTGQVLNVTNSDPVTHNIHPLAQVNREWNHSQAAGDAPLARKFSRPEIMIKVKCNIHNWMRAYLGVLKHPYFAVTGADGSFEIGNIPPGKYTITAWHEKLGTQDQKVTIDPKATIDTKWTFKGD